MIPLNGWLVPYYQNTLTPDQPLGEVFRSVIFCCFDFSNKKPENEKKKWKQNWKLKQTN